MASLDDIFLALGELKGGVDALRRDFQEEKSMAHESRATIHRRLDQQAEEISKVRTDVAVDGEITAQVRNEVKSLKEAVNPSLEEWKRMKMLGIGIAGLLALGGLSVGAALMWASDTAATAIRHWLKIN
ncbi:DUF1515 domain-containing protein [Mesorhizobium sp. M4A.F.Ca.ET.020.02.1.1]|uniref:DUF1515 family protein n=1 Tax=Mesorhizobium sp. M4A.F.Ca.ET.020.02.1.1 TaxID=2496652 RepID=UPI000FD54200|nr:DUF1515 family protein [Mesorhizobium sp. M4A.F.Ca.ET.020.02.1.1]RVD44655.1 DUF1515 domain-containing protein [Mesorhizobium sp. M4A.F.Ca.ET.020.02.1.1]